LISAAFSLSLISCGPDEAEVQFGSVGFVEGFFGAVAADEPNSVLVGRDILASGGSAADAAVAVGFAMAVTLPSRASLGGGGLCMIHDPDIGSTEVIDFIAPAGTPIGQSSDRPSAVPALARGLVALHARYGTLDWRAVLRPAEDLARFGHRMPRALHSDLERAAKPLFADPQTRRIFGTRLGEPIEEGAKYRQLDLATILGQIRINGAGAMYSGPLARSIVEAVNRAGGTLTIEDLREWLPQWRATVVMPLNVNPPYEMHAAPLPASAGILAAQMYRMLDQEDRYFESDPAVRRHLLAEVAMRAFAGRAGWLKQDFTAVDPLDDLLDEETVDKFMTGYSPDRAQPADTLDPAPVLVREDPGGASFVVVDRRGAAVACSLTMYYLFGTGRVAPGTGILLAAAPNSRAGRNPLSLGPVMVVQPASFRFKFAGTASGGVTASTSLANILARTMIEQGSARDAVDAPRVHHGGSPDAVVVEKAIGEEAIIDLRRRGHEVKTVEKFGSANVIFCPSGLPPEDEETPLECTASGDRRGSGMAIQAD